MVDSLSDVQSRNASIVKVEEQTLVVDRWSPMTRPRSAMVELMGLEPTTPCLQSRCSRQLSYSPWCLMAGSSVRP